MFVNMVIEYPVLLIKSIGSYTFEALGRVAKKSGDTITRLLQPAWTNYGLLQAIAQKLFEEDKRLYLIIDDTLLRKVFSQYIEGSGQFFDTRVGRRVMGLRLLVAAVTNGRYTIPIMGQFLFSKEVLQDSIQSKDQIVKTMIKKAIALFPNATVTIVADGAFATQELLRWCAELCIRIECRMHSNRKVVYKGIPMLIRDIRGLQPTGRAMARTIAVTWHDIPLYITAQRRIDKNGKESIVFQAATYKAKPAVHVYIYQIRWNIEKLFRTTKQHLGLQGCSARKLESQEAHVGAALLAYAFLQVDMKNRKQCTPEHALRASSHKNVNFLNHKFCRILQNLSLLHA